MKKKAPPKYMVSLKLDGDQREPIKRIAKKNRHTINDEIVIAVQNHISKEDDKKG